MSQDDFKPKLGRMRDAGRVRLVKHTTRVFRQAGKAGVRALRQKGHVSPSALRRGMGAGVRAAAGLIAPGSRRVIVKARYTRIVGGDLGAARAHLRYILRDGVTREGMAGHLYDASHDEADGSAFLARSEQDPHQFRFIVSPEDSARLADLKPFIRDLLGQMERDLETKLDWVAVDHFNTGHPHTHVVIRGRDDQGQDLVMARDYIAHGVRARAQGLITLELGPETDLERTQKLFNETGQERLTRLDRSLLARAKDGILVVTTAEEQDPVQQTLRIGRLKTLERLGLAQERQQGVWQLDGKLESKLRRLGDRADKFRTMQQVLRELGIDRGAAAMALFERGPRKTPLIGKVIGVGMVDEITDRTWVVVDAVDGRVHYADLGRIRPADVPQRGMLVALAGDETLRGKPTSVPRIEVLSAVEISRLASYEGPTWLDEAIIGRLQVWKDTPGFPAELRQALADRGRWLAGQGLAAVSGLDEIAPKPEMEALQPKRIDAPSEISDRAPTALYLILETLVRDYDASYHEQWRGYHDALRALGGVLPEWSAILQDSLTRGLYGMMADGWPMCGWISHDEIKRAAPTFVDTKRDAYFEALQCHAKQGYWYGLRDELRMFADQGASMIHSCG